MVVEGVAENKLVEAGGFCYLPRTVEPEQLTLWRKDCPSWDLTALVLLLALGGFNNRDIVALDVSPGAVRGVPATGRAAVRPTESVSALNCVGSGLYVPVC